MIYSVNEIQKRLAPIFKESDVKSAVLFGSYGKGEADENSDVDLLVDSGLRGLRFVGLIGYIRDALQKEVDVFDAAQLKPGSRMELTIKQDGVRIYG